MEARSALSEAQNQDHTRTLALSSYSASKQVSFRHTFVQLALLPERLQVVIDRYLDMTPFAFYAAVT